MLVEVGVDHRTAPLAVRERLSFGPAAAREWLALARLHGMQEGVLLSTCNRTEAYLLAAEEAWPVLRSWLAADWARRASRSPAALEALLRVRMREEAVRHLFRVASGLESILVGEGEILAQVKEAYAAARAADSVGARLHGLFQAALRVGRQARRESDLGRYALAPGAAVVAMAQEALGELAGRSAWVWGSGAMGRPVVEHLAAAGLAVTVTSRTPAHARAAAGAVAAVRPWSERRRALAEADALVLAVGGEGPWLGAEEAARAMAARPGRPLFVFDFGVPRNAEEGVAAVEGVTWRGVDDLRRLVEANRTRRQAAADAAARAVDAAVAEFMRLHRERRAAPLIRSLYDKAEAVRRAELERTLRRLPDLGAAERAAVEQLTRRIVRRLLNDPALALRSGAAEGDATDLMRAAASLFGLEAGEEVEGG
ncbi:MAG: glutamyl-tRNA reductase [Firmicutes bacterium]|nr:glutamyl-tRNA reductase [Bacillota bacterium]